MKKLVILALFLAACKPSALSVANEKLGGGALCTTQQNSNEIVCMKKGTRYSCIVDTIHDTAECAVTNVTPPEGK